MNKYFWLVAGLCTFIVLLSFKPSEPYLSEYLICNYNTQESICNDDNGCDFPCQSSHSTSCNVIPCSNVSYSDCGGTNTIYCVTNDSPQQCVDASCYKSFSENQVNNQIYPWSTYSYLLFLITMGPLTEVFSYKFAILVGIMGRVATRIILLYGTTLYQMQIMQVTYAFGTAAEDLFSAYIYTVVPLEMYQSTTSYVKTSALLSCIVSGVLGDILVTQFDVSLYTLTVISAVFVIAGAVLGFFVIRNPSKSLPLAADLETSDEDTTALKIESSSGFTRVTEYSVRATYEWMVNTWMSIDLISTKRYLAEKYQILYIQLRFTLNVVSKRDVRVLTAYWIIGNGVYTILYGYEVSIYSELNNSDNWNGTVLAVMLLAGCFGAMLPVWMKLDPSMVEETSGGVAKPVEEGTDDRTNEVAPRVSTWKVNSSLVVMTIISCVCLIIFSLSWELYASVAMLVGFFASWQFVNVVFYARIATCISESGAMYSQLVRNFRSRNSNGSISNQDYHRSTEVDVGRRSLLGAGGTSSDSFGIQSSHLSVPTYADDGDTSLRVGNDSVIDEREQALVEELPPYSVSIIFLITASVLFQVIIQIILFSSLQLSLKPISIILTFLFCVFSFIFCLDVIRYHLWQSS